MAINFDYNIDKITLDEVEANSFVKTGGTSTQFLKADGTVDSNTYLTSFTEVNDLTINVTWDIVPDAYISQSSVTQHQAALTITTSQISDYVVSSLTDLSVTSNPASGGGTLSYDNISGTFTYTPPDLSGFLTDAPSDGNPYARQNGTWTQVVTNEVNDLTASVTWANVPDANITSSSVTQHQAALSITESQISDLQTYYLASNPNNYISTAGEINDLTASVTWANVPDVNITQSSVTQHQAALSITESQISDLQNYYLASNPDGYIDITVPTLDSVTDNNATTTNAITVGNITTTGYLAGPATFTIDPAAIGDNTGLVVIAGSLQVDGTTTTINSTTVEVDDKNILLGEGSINASAADGGGITLDCGTDVDATILYDAINDQWDINKDITAPSFIKNGGVSTEFLKADGSVDSTTYLTANDPTLDSVTDNNNITTNDIIVGSATIRTTSQTVPEYLTFNPTATNYTASEWGGILIESSDPSGAGSGVKGSIRAISDTGTAGRLSWEFSIADGTVNDKFAMRIDDNGRLGIGEEDPAALLHLGTSDPRIRLDQNNSIGYSEIYVSSLGDLVLHADSGDNVVPAGILKFSVGPATDAMIITELGNVNIGPSVIDPRSKLTLVDSSVSLGDTATSGGTAWNTAGHSQAFLYAGNNGLAIGLDGSISSRKGWLQVGHASESFSDSLGTLSLNPLGGNVEIGGALSVGNTEGTNYITETDAGVTISGTTTNDGWVEFGDFPAGIHYVRFQETRNSVTSHYLYCFVIHTDGSIIYDDVSYTGDHSEWAHFIEDGSSGKVGHLGPFWKVTGSTYTLYFTLPTSFTANLSSDIEKISVTGTSWDASFKQPIFNVTDLGTTAPTGLYNYDTPSRLFSERVGGNYIGTKMLLRSVGGPGDPVDEAGGELRIIGNTAFAGGCKPQVSLIDNLTAFFLQTDTSTNTFQIGYNSLGHTYSPTVLAVINSSGNMGINETDPETSLHITQATDSSADGIRLARSNGAASYTQWVDTNAVFNIGYSNPDTTDPSNSIMTLQGATRQVGIVTTSPDTLFEMEAPDTTTDAALTIAVPSSATADPLVNFRLIGNTIWSVGADATDGYFKIGRGGTLNNLATNTNLVIDSTGNVGIGTSTIDSGIKLQVAGDIKHAGKVASGAAVYLGSTTNWVKIFERHYLTASSFGYGGQDLTVITTGQTDGHGSTAKFHITTKQQGTADEFSVIWSSHAGQAGLEAAYYYDSTGGDDSAGILTIWVRPGSSFNNITVHSNVAGTLDKNNTGLVFATDTGSSTQPASSTLLTPAIRINESLTTFGGNLTLDGTNTFTGTNIFDTATNTVPVNITRLGSSSDQTLQIGVTDGEAIFNYIEDTTSEGTGNYGNYKFQVSGNEGTSPTVDVLTLNAGTSIFYSDVTLNNVKLRLTKQDDLSLSSTAHAFQIGPDAGINLAIDGNEIMARNNGAASPLYLNAEGGTVSIGGQLQVSSTNGLRHERYQTATNTFTIEQANPTRYVRLGLVPPGNARLRITWTGNSGYNNFVADFSTQFKGSAGSNGEDTTAQVQTVYADSGNSEIRHLYFEYVNAQAAYVWALIVNPAGSNQVYYTHIEGNFTDTTTLTWSSPTVNASNFNASAPTANPAAFYKNGKVLIGSNDSFNTTPANDPLTVSNSTPLGSTLYDTQPLQTWTGGNGNVGFLELFQFRHTAGSTWTQTSTRLQQRIDSTYQGYIQFNGPGNTYGVSLGYGTGTPADIEDAVDGLILDISGNVEIPVGNLTVSSGSVSSDGIAIETSVIDRLVDNSVLNIYGGSTTDSANLELYGGSHASFPGYAFYDAAYHTIRSISTGIPVNHLTLDGLGRINLTPTDTTPDSNVTGLTLDLNPSGADVLTGDRTHRGILIDIDSSATGGDTTNEHRLYGVYADVRATGDSDLIYGGFFYARSDHSAGTITNVNGSVNQGLAHSNAGGVVTNVRGGYNLGYGSNVETITNVIGTDSLAAVTATGNGDVTNLEAMRAEVDTNGAYTGTVFNAFGARITIDNNTGSSDTITNSYILYGDYQGALPTNSYGVYIADDVDNYFRGTIVSAKSENTDILRWSSSGYLKRLTTQGGFFLGGDSSGIIHAGDQENSLRTALGIVNSTTTENLYFVADGNVQIRTNWQDVGNSNDRTWTFGTDGNLAAPGNITAASLIKSGGTSSQFLKADGSVDSSAYISTSATQSANIYIRNGSPTIYLRDDNNISSMIHCNSDLFYILRADAADDVTWTTYSTGDSVNGRWPLTINLTNTNPYFAIGPSNVTAGGYTVWHSGNDGPSSGLAAQTADTVTINAENDSDNTARDMLYAIGSNIHRTSNVTYNGSQDLFRVFSGSRFDGATSFYSDITISGGTIDRAAIATGFLNGKYSGVETSTSTGAIYAIGDSWLPSTTTLSNHYGIGYTNSNASFITFETGSWGQYVSADGDARIWFNATNGNIFATGNITAYASDARLKTNVKPIENAVDKLQKIRGVSYDWVDDIESEYGFTPKSKHEVGVLAQEVEEVLPEVVRTAPFNGIYNQSQAHKNIEEKLGLSNEDAQKHFSDLPEEERAEWYTENNFLTVDYERIVPLLIEAIKEQQAQIDELKGMIK